MSASEENIFNDILSPKMQKKMYKYKTFKSTLRYLCVY